MDENMSENDNRENSSGRSDSPKENVKRLKTDTSSIEKSEESSSSSNITGSIEKSEESSSSSNNTEQESTSTDSGFPRSRNSRNRSYRNQLSNEDISDNRSNEEDSDMQDDSEYNNLSQLFNNSSPGSSDSTVIHDSDNESGDEHPVFSKPKPKHNWFIVPEVINRQIGFSSKLQSSQLFQRRCYGSLHSVQRLELMYKLEEHNGCVNSLNFHPDGSLLASGSDDQMVVLWDWKIGKSLLKYHTEHRGNVFQSKFLNLSGDLHIATCARDGQVRLAQVSKEEGVRDNRKLGSHRGPCHKLAVLAEQPHVILSAGEDGVVLSHDVRVNKPERIVTVKEDDREVALYSIHGHPLKTQEFCVSGRDPFVRTYDQRKSTEPLSTYVPYNPVGKNSGIHVTCAIYNHNGTEILASYNDADIYLFDIKSEPGNYKREYTGHRNGATIKGVNFFGPKSEFIVSGSDCGNLYFWDRNTEAIVQWLLADDSGVVNCLEPHPQLPYICTSGLDWDVKVWVPSCENEPAMANLEKTVKNNSKERHECSSPADINESQMLWMLWRHFRRGSNRRHFRMRHTFNRDAGNILLQINSHYSSSARSSSSNSDSNDEEDDDDDEDEDFDGPIGCSPS